MHVFKGYMYHGYISTGALLKVASAMLGDVTSVGICSEIKQTEPVCVPYSKNYHEGSAKPHNTATPGR